MRDGSTRVFDAKSFGARNEELWPFFVNEAAYYKKDVALCLATKKVRRVKTLVVTNGSRL